MRVIKLNSSNHTFSLHNKRPVISLRHIGRPGVKGDKGDQGEPGKVLVESVNGKQGVVVLDKSDVGLSNVDNTSDMDKPISTAVQDALDDIDSEVDNAVKKTGDTMTGDLDIASSYPSDDVVGGIDGTRRLNLHSFQRANVNSFGETIRHFLMRKDAKAMEAYYVPKLGYNADGTPNADLNPDGTPANIAQWQPVSWTGSHFQANDHNSNHVHWELEIPDSSGALQGRLEVPFADPITGVIGLDKTFIRTNLADLVVRTSNNQMLRLSSPSGNHKPIEFNHDSEGSSSFRRWIVRANGTAESGSNTGTDFQIVRYADDGTFLDSPVFIQRSTGYLGIGTITTPSRISLASATNAAGGISFGSDTNLYRSATNQLRTDDKLFAALGLDAGSNKVTNVASGTTSSDAVNKAQLDTKANVSDLALKENISNKDQPNGYAGLDSSGKISSSELPSLVVTETFVVADQAAMLALSAQQGDVAVRTDLSKSFILAGTDPSVLADWQELLTPTQGVQSFNGRTGSVTPEVGDYTASMITNVPAGTISATSVQAAIDELDSEKANATSLSNYVLKSGDTMIGKLSIEPSSAPSGGALSIRQFANNNSNGLIIRNNTDGTQGFFFINGSSGTPLVINSNSSGSGNLSLNSGGGNVIIGGLSPTHSLTLSSIATGIALYNTADQATNYERIRQYWNGNTWTIVSENAGTGTRRPLFIGGASAMGMSMNDNGGSSVTSPKIGLVVPATGAAYPISAVSTLSASSGMQNGFTIAPTSNGSGTQGYTALLVNATETSVGSGLKLLADFQVGGSSRATVNNAGDFYTSGAVKASGAYPATPTGDGVYLGIPTGLNPRFSMVNGTAVSAIDTDPSGVIRFLRSSAGVVVGQMNGNGLILGSGLTGSLMPTHSLTLPSISTGVGYYNTADQTTNYERFRVVWSSNVLNLVNDFSGTGAARSILLSAFGAGSTSGLRVNSTSTLGFVQSSGSSSTASAILHSVTGTLSSSTGIQYGLSITPAMGQSATAGYTGLLVNVTETSVGSGAKNLIDLQVGNTSRFKVDNAGRMSMAVSTAPAAPNDGDIWFDGTDLKMRIGGVTRTFTMV